MLTKILFTLIVIIGVALFYRNKNMSSESAQPKKAVTEAEGPLSTRTLAYGIIGLLVLLSCGIFAYHWNQGNQIVNIRVTSEGGNMVNYQAHHRDIKGRKFVSLDGIQVTLGESDRVEMLQQ